MTEYFNWAAFDPSFDDVVKGIDDVVIGVDDVIPIFHFTP